MNVLEFKYGNEKHIVVWKWTFPPCIILIWGIKNYGRKASFGAHSPDPFLRPCPVLQQGLGGAAARPPRRGWEVPLPPSPVGAQEGFVWN